MTDVSSEAAKPRTTRPALDVLDHDLDRLLFEGDPTRDPPIRAFADGFRNLWEALAWYQAAGIRTLGHIESVIEPRHMLPLSDAFKYMHAGRGPVYKRGRESLCRQLIKASNDGYFEFRERANERVEDSEASTWKDVDPESERNPLMRPAFRRRDRSQAGALISLWDGFEDRKAISRWVRSLTVPTHGETPEGLLDDIYRSSTLEGALTDQESDSAKRIRYRLGVNALLPSFLDAARSLTGSERTDSSGATHGAWNS